jgi:hypothetical protein
MPAHLASGGARWATTGAPSVAGRNRHREGHRRTQGGAVDVLGVASAQRQGAGNPEHHGSPRLRRTSQWSRRPIAPAPASLPLPGAGHRQRSAPRARKKNHPIAWAATTKSPARCFRRWVVSDPLGGQRTSARCTARAAARCSTHRGPSLSGVNTSSCIPATMANEGWTALASPSIVSGRSGGLLIESLLLVRKENTEYGPLCGGILGENGHEIEQAARRISLTLSTRRRQHVSSCASPTDFC